MALHRGTAFTSVNGPSGCQFLPEAIRRLVPFGAATAYSTPNRWSACRPGRPAC